MQKWLRWILIVSVMAALAISVTAPVLAQDGNPTAEGTPAEGQPTGGLPWYVGVLLLVVIFVGLTVYKNRYQATRKKPVLNAACCAPIIEDGDNPFHPSEDETEDKSKSSS